MPDFPDTIQYRTGPDRRLRRRVPQLLGRVAGSSFVGISADGVSGLNPRSPFLSTPSIGKMIPIVVDSSNVPFSADSQGTTFPSGTLWVITAFGIGSIIGFPAGADVTVSPAGLPYPHRKQWYLIVICGMDAGTTGTIEFSKDSGATVLSTKIIDGANGASQIIPVDEFDGFTPDENILEIHATWTGTEPPYYFIAAHPYYAATFYAVPDTLPAGYTARTGAEDQLSQRMQASRNLDTGLRLRGATYAPPGNAGLSGDALGLFIDGALKRHNDWQPTAKDQDTALVTQIFNNDIYIPPPVDLWIDVPRPVDVTLVGVGWRDLRIKVDPTSVVGLPSGGSFTWTITRSDTGGTTTVTKTDAEIAAGFDDSLGAFVPSDLEVLTLTISLSAPAHHYQGTAFTVTFEASWRCDVPFQFTAAGPDGLIAPGGYVPDFLTDPVNDAPMIQLAAGVTSYAPGYSGLVAYLPSSDGWYRIVQSSADRTGVGEYEFGYLDGQRTAARGHTGRPFYVVAGSGSAAVLTAYTPSFSAISSGGTSLATNVKGVWGFGSIDLPAAGTYEIAIVVSDAPQLANGLVYEWSTDSLCVNPEGRITWEAWNVFPTVSGLTFHGLASTPPGSPSDGDVYIVDAGATGAWEGHDGDVAHYGSLLNRWCFCTPQSGQYCFDIDGMFFDGQAWREFSDPVIRHRITVDAPTTLYCTFGAYSETPSASTPHVSVSWASV